MKTRTLATLAAVGCFGLFAAASPATAETPAGPAGDVQERFEEANAHYLDGEYELAARLYGQIMNDHHVDDPALYLNLGNAYFRAGAFGSAIFAYRRGLRAGPAEALARDLDANLAVTRRALQERYRSGADKSQFFFAEPGGFLYRVSHVLSEPVLVTLFLATWVLFFGLLVLGRTRWRPRWNLAAAIPAGLVAALLGLILWGQVYTDSGLRLAVVITDGATLREGRHMDARGVDLPEGMEVRIVEADEDWVRVELSNGREGWVRAQSVKQI